MSLVEKVLRNRPAEVEADSRTGYREATRSPLPSSAIPHRIISATLMVLVDFGEARWNVALAALMIPGGGLRSEGPQTYRPLLKGRISVARHR